jgi:perosamine synthetase
LTPNQGQSYERGLCPVAERIQPRLLQFKTNYFNAADVARASEALARTIRFFDSRAAIRSAAE